MTFSFTTPCHCRRRQVKVAVRNSLLLLFTRRAAPCALAVYPSVVCIHACACVWGGERVCRVRGGADAMLMRQHGSDDITC